SFGHNGQTRMAESESVAVQRTERRKMKPERWKQIDEILEAAIDLGPARRDAFLDRACAGDEELRKEIESLLAAHDRATGFINTSPAGAAIELIESSINRQTLPDRPAVETRRGRKIALMIIACAAIALTAFGIYKLISRDEPAKESSKIVPVTQAGDVLVAAISPDGKRVAYVAGDGQQSLRVRNLDARSDAEIIPAAPVDYRSLMFSIDGRHVYFIRSDNKSAPEQLLYEASLYRARASDGEAKELIKGVGAPFAISADGQRLAFARLSARGTSLIVADKDGSRQRTFFELNRSDRLTHLAWSIDGKSVVCSIEDSTEARLVEINAESGERKTISSGAWEKIYGICRLQDGRFVIAARRAESESSQLWIVSAGLEPQKITDDLKDYSSPSCGGDFLIAIQASETSGIVVSLRGETSPSGPTAAGCDGRFGLSFAPNGKILFTSEKEAESNIAVMDLDGSNKKQLTSNAGVNRFPSASADGRHIVFVSTSSGISNVWRMNIDGSQQTQLTRSERGRILWPQCSTDSKWIVYALADNGKTTLWKTSIDGGNSIQLTDVNSFHPALSPDGKSIAYLAGDGRRAAIGIIRFEGGRVKTLEPAPGRVNAMRWSADSRALIYSTTRDGVSNLWIQPADGSAPRQMTDYKDGLIFSFDTSPDGRWLAISRGQSRSDVVLISNFSRWIAMKK
ncbi:MAG: hypothetical protein AB1631_32860, partial [Acidobacteriota bacterium]